MEKARDKQVQIVWLSENAISNSVEGSAGESRNGPTEEWNCSLQRRGPRPAGRQSVSPQADHVISLTITDEGCSTRDNGISRANENTSINHEGH